MVVLATLAWLVLGVVVAFVALLFVPVDFALSAGTATGVRLRVRWLWVRLEHAWPAGGGATVESVPDRRGRSLQTARIARRLLAIDGLVARFARLARELLGSLAWRRGRVAVRMGLGDPADTGELCGWVVPVLLAVRSRTALEIEFQPEFAEASFDASAEGSGRFVPARAVAALGRFAASRPGLRFMGVVLWRRER